MGGKSTAVNEYTKTVFVECALFDPVRIALTGRRQQIAQRCAGRGSSAAWIRAFCRTRWTQRRQMILSICGGEPSEQMAAGAEPNWRRSATLRFERLAGLAECGSAAGRCRGNSAAPGIRGAFAHGAGGDGGAVPPWRNDVAGDTKLAHDGSLDDDRVMRAAEGAALIEPESGSDRGSAADPRPGHDSRRYRCRTRRRCRKRR